MVASSKGTGMEGELDVTEAEMRADLDRALGVDPDGTSEDKTRILLHPGPEWYSMAGLTELYKLPQSTVTRIVNEKLGKTLEERRGVDRRTGKLMTLYRSVQIVKE